MQLAVQITDIFIQRRFITIFHTVYSVAPGSIFSRIKPSLRGATGKLDYHVRCLLDISTHAPFAGRDRSAAAVAARDAISTHMPLAGRDAATKGVFKCCPISTHTPLAGRDENECGMNEFLQISTHTPLAGRDS